jgi:hypothetical protein
MVKVFEDGMRAVLAVVCCTAVMVCGGVSGMDIEGVSASYTGGGSVYQQYANDYVVWRSDGARFIVDSFIDEYTKNGSVPELNDGRPELHVWLYLTSNSNVFEMEWGGTRPDGLEFLKCILNEYSRYGKESNYLTNEIMRILEASEYSIY